MEVVQIVCTVIQVLVSVALVVVVLLQSGKESGLSGALSGKNETYMTKNAGGNMDKKLTAATKWIALAWIVLTLGVGLLYA